MSATDGTHISRQSASYRQGLVLGLTMAEIMILLVFCLLIALAAFLQKEQAKRIEVEKKRDQAEMALRKEQDAARNDRDFMESIKKDPRLSELLKSRPSHGDAGELDEFWRELVEGRSVVTAAKQTGLTSADIKSRMTDIKVLKEKGIDVREIERNALITASVDKAMPSATPEKAAHLIERGLIEQAFARPASEGHKWPPIIALNDASGRFFKSGSAEVDPDFRQVLVDKTAPRIAEIIKEYDVDVIEVVGHTDERPVGKRQSNLDSELIPVLNNASRIATIMPSDNAGLGLARAVSVVSILRESKNLEGYKILPLSGGQLVNTNETLALGGGSGDVPERRRIEIRLRKASPRDTIAQQQQPRSAIETLVAPSSAMPTPKKRPAALVEEPPVVRGPMQIIPPSSLLPSWLFQQSER